MSTISSLGRTWKGLVAGTVMALAAMATVARAGDIEFSASVDQTTVGIGEQFQLVLAVQGEDMLSVPSPVVPSMPDLNVLGQTSSQSTNISIINGQMKKQATVNFIYVLSAKRLGKVTIPACKLSYQGKDYQSQPIEITVVKAAQGQAAPPSGMPGMPGMPGAPAPRASVPLEGNLMLSVAPSRRTAYVGEPIAVDVSLATRFQITNGGWAQPPAFDGFWAEKVFDADRFDFQRRTVDGKAFAVAELKKAVLFPLTAGDAEIKPMSFNVTVAQPPRDIFDVFGSAQSVRVESKPVKLKILPLPEQGKPAEFTGGVGTFHLTAALDRATTTNGEPVNLTIQLSGVGNLRMIDPPTIPPVAGLKILAPESKDDAHVIGDGVRGTKTFRFPILPQSDGRFEIAPITLATFDPEARAYQRLTTPSFTFTASGATTANAPATEASGLKVLGSDIDYIKPDASSLDALPMEPPGWPNAMVLVSLGAVGGAIGFRAHAQRLRSDRGYARKTRSSALVKRRLKQAEHLLRAHDVRGFHAELSRAFVGYLGDRFNIDTHALTRDQLRAALAERAVPAETVEAALAVVDRCEIARFAPGDAAGPDAPALLETARGVMARL